MSSALYMSHFPNFSLEGDQDHGPTLTLANDPSLIYPFVIDNSRDQGSRVGHHEQTEAIYPFVMNSSNNQEGRVEGHDQREVSHISNRKPLIFVVSFFLHIDDKYKAVHRNILA